MHRRDFMFPSVDAARTLASRIPNAHLTILDGASAAPFLEDSETVIRSINAFVGSGEDSATKPDPPPPGAHARGASPTRHPGARSRSRAR